jgi:hypothetical protein
MIAIGILVPASYNICNAYCLANFTGTHSRTEICEGTNPAKSISCSRRFASTHLNPIFGQWTDKMRVLGSFPPRILLGIEAGIRNAFVQDSIQEYWDSSQHESGILPRNRSFLTILTRFTTT